MSTPDQPDTPQLTRKQLREFRNTGTTPVVTPSDEDSPTEPAPAAPLPRPAEPTVVAPAPVPDDSVDLGTSPLTRRQARQHERIRTASVPVITPDVVAEHEAARAADDAASDPQEPADASSEDTSAPISAADVSAPEVDDADPDAEERPVVSPALGAGLLSGDAIAVNFPPTFDQLLARDTASTGSISASSALVLSQDPAAAPLGAIGVTGEVLVTGTYALPEGLGSVGHAPGVADGKDVDAVLIDGELPPASSPTPIAASAAVSTSKSAGEVIRPPAPEKGSRLLLTLAITAGALALALVGALVWAVSTGVFA